MNTQLKNKTLPTFLMLLVGIVVVLLGGPSIQAQTATTDTTATAAAPAATVDSSITISAKGSVTDPNGTITVSGSVIVNCRRVIATDSATTPSLVLLDFDFSQLRGTSGSLKTLKTFVTGDNHATEIRPLQATDTIIVTNPYYDSTKDALSAKSWLVTSTLNFDVSTGKLTSGSISIGDNVVTKSTVGTFTATAP